MKTAKGHPEIKKIKPKSKHHIFSHSAKGSITNPKYVHIESSFLTVNQISEAITQEIKDSLDPDIKNLLNSKFYINLVVDHEGKTFGYGYIYFEDEKLAYALTDRNLDGSPRSELIDDPNWIDPYDSDLEDDEPENFQQIYQYLLKKSKDDPERVKYFQEHRYYIEAYEYQRTNKKPTNWGDLPCPPKIMVREESLIIVKPVKFTDEQKKMFIEEFPDLSGVEEYKILFTPDRVQTDEEKLKEEIQEAKKQGILNYVPERITPFTFYSNIPNFIKEKDILNIFERYISGIKVSIVQSKKKIGTNNCYVKFPSATTEFKFIKHMTATTKVSDKVFIHFDFARN